jgi:Tfp pilus tip-associated adhesin PilY1
MQEYTGASFDTPSISDISVEYEYVSRLEYSRASAAATIVTRSGETKKLIIGSSFIYPGWEGQLRAYDVTQLRVTGNAYSALSTVTASDLGSATGRTLSTGTEMFWDAGTILKDRSPDGRVIYTAIRANRVLTNPLQRINFTSSNATTLRNFLNDTNNNPSGLISFIRGQVGEWKLRDINHSTPVVVGPPDGDPVLMGSGYDTFKQYWENRTKVIYVGANDGMLHCFSLETGEELWGFIPYNLLRKLTNQWRVDTTNNTRYYFHDIFVDGSPSVADVYYNNAWHTILICGQGPGRGNKMASGFDGGVNFYFALDITNPTDPRPLWEITHSVNAGTVSDPVILSTMGETWSVPAIGKINDSILGNCWVAFMGSGYNNVGQSTAGRNFYVVRADTGGVINTFSTSTNNPVTDVDTSSLSAPKSLYSYTNIPVALVSSPTALDSNDDGKIESVYVGDLDGRLYKMDMTSTNRNNWTLNPIYTDYLNYPIITKPAVWIDTFATPRTPRIFFGTGGDEGAPTTRDYSFVCVQDTTPTATVEWYLGLPTPLNQPLSKQVGGIYGLGTESDPHGYKVWADPVVADYTVYFSTLQGSIENVNPCVNLGTGLLYARNIRPGFSGMVAGASAFKSADVVPPEFLQMISKARRAVTVGEIARQGNVNKREVFIQEYNSTIEMLEQPVATSRLQIKSWREIYKIIR